MTEAVAIVSAARAARQRRAYNTVAGALRGAPRTHPAIARRDGRLFLTASFAQPWLLLSLASHSPRNFCCMCECVLQNE